MKEEKLQVRHEDLQLNSSFKGSVYNGSKVNVWKNLPCWWQEYIHHEDFVIDIFPVVADAPLNIVTDPGLCHNNDVVHLRQIKHCEHPAIASYTIY